MHNSNPAHTGSRGSFRIHEIGTAQRQATEAFIRGQFQSQFGARVEHFLPLLLSVHDSHDQLQAALGLRAAFQQPLFLERYLDRPIEHLLSARAHKPVTRGQVVELGNLASRSRGSSRQLIVAMAEYLQHSDYQWIVCTIAPVLANAFCRLGLSLIDLGAADVSRLPADERHQWGSYYLQRPRVMAGRIGDALPLLCAGHDAHGEAA